MKTFLTLTITLLVVSACSTSRPISATSNTLGNSKGVACAVNVLGFIPLDTDASIFKAAQNGNIRKISTVDYEGFYSGFYNKDCTIVRGDR